MAGPFMGRTVQSILHCLESGVGVLVLTNNLFSELACAQDWASFLNCDYVTCFGQWNVSRKDMCPFWVDI